MNGFEKLLENNKITKKQMKTAESLSKRFLPTNKHNLEKANNLLFELFFDENIEEAEIVMNIITKIKFNGNFQQWSFVEPSYCLKYYLSRDCREKEEITKMLIYDVRSEWDDEIENLEFKKRIMDGELVESSKRRLDDYLNNEKNEYMWRIPLIIDYLKVIALGSNGLLSYDIAIKEIEENIEREKELYKKFKDRKLV